MMLYGPIRPALLGLIQNLVKLNSAVTNPNVGNGPPITPNDTTVVWADQPIPYTPPNTKTIFKLSLSPLSSKGADDESRWSYDPTQPQGAEMQETITGYRLFTLKILCESYDQTDTGTAFNYLEEVRTRLRWLSSRLALKAVNVAVVRFEDIQDLSRKVDNRQASIANLDVRLSTRTAEADPNRTGYIETVAGPTGTLT